MTTPTPTPHRAPIDLVSRGIVERCKVATMEDVPSLSFEVFHLSADHASPRTIRRASRALHRVITASKEATTKALSAPPPAPPESRHLTPEAKREARRTKRLLQRDERIARRAHKRTR